MVCIVYLQKLPYLAILISENQVDLSTILQGKTMEFQPGSCGEQNALLGRHEREGDNRI